jgi:hypothetical protein
MMCPPVQCENVADYCERRIDKISYILTHKMYHDESDRQFQLGSMDAYEDIYRMICEEQVR